MRVSHFPPGTSKWNKIEHRLFSFISKNWRGKPLISLAVIVNLIGATTKNHTEYLPFYGEYLFTLREYPIKKLIEICRVKQGIKPIPIKKTYIRSDPKYSSKENLPHTLVIDPIALRGGAELIKVRYSAGYACGEAPADLASACMELAAWNMSRYRGRRIGITGTVRGRGQDGEHLEASMPENVRSLLEPYRRKLI
jgi:hypothetical protein